MTELPTEDEIHTAARTCLTERQLRVWELHARGLSQNQIADRLRITRGSVRDHLKAIARRLDHHFTEGSDAD